MTPKKNDETAPAEGETTPAAKAPRRESTKIAAANKWACSHAKPAELLKLLDANPDQRGQLLGGHAAELEADEKSLAAKRADYRGRKEFALEIEGLPPMALVGIRGILNERAK